MDVPKKDELRQRRRDQALARQLGEALDQLSTREVAECPDAETIAAYYEQALGNGESARWEDHFAKCPRCRKILAVLGASVEVPLAENEVARLGELVASATRPSEVAQPPRAKPLSQHRWDWRARWLAPALGVAAVLTVWVAMRGTWHATSPEPSGTLIAQALKNESLPSPETPPVDLTLKAAPTWKSEPAKNRLDESRATDGFEPSAEVAKNSSRAEKKEQTEMGSAVAAAPPSSPVLPAVSMPRPLAQAQSEAAVQAGPSAPEAPASSNQSVALTGEAPIISTAQGGVSSSIADNIPARDKQALAERRRVADVPLNGRNVQALAVLDGANEMTAPIRAPTGKVSWRVGKNGRIERSTDAGNAWILQASPLREEWLSGTAVSDTICWIVGRNGAIARTTDGEHWERIDPPPQATDSSAKLPDWIGITARDAQTATITTRDGRRFVTRDAGKTWQAQ